METLLDMLSSRENYYEEIRVMAEVRAFFQVSHKVRRFIVLAMASTLKISGFLDPIRESLMKSRTQ